MKIRICCLSVFLDGNLNDEFVLNGSTGQLTVNKDLEGGSEYQLIIQATDFFIPPSPAFTLVTTYSIRQSLQCGF